MRALRSVLALVIGLGLLTAIASLAVHRTTRHWFENDVSLRARLAVAGARETLVSRWSPDQRIALRNSLSAITHDERIMAAAACDTNLSPLATTPEFPKSFACARLGPRVHPVDGAAPNAWRPWESVERLPGGSVHVSAIPMLDQDRPLWFVVGTARAGVAAGRCAGCWRRPPRLHQGSGGAAARRGTPARALPVVPGSIQLRAARRAQPDRDRAIPAAEPERRGTCGAHQRALRRRQLSPGDPAAAPNEPPTVFRYYRAANLCYVSSLHDGMKLVAKEFVAAREDGQGVLLLSQLTGTARELTEALIVNPYDLDQVSTALAAALEMSVDEQRDRMRAMRSFVSEFNVYRWAGRMLVDAARLHRRERLTGRLASQPLVETESLP